MGKYIDADLYVEMQIYDDEHEEWSIWNGTIEELLDQWTEEGCPTPIEVSEGNQVLYGTDHNCILTIFGECSYDETGCGDCAVAEKIRKALSVEVSEDCISREWLEEHKKVISYTNEWRETETDEFVSWKNIKNAPSVVLSRAEGEWILECDAEGEGENLYRCPECGQRCGCQEYDLPNYCGNCGAKMKGWRNEA